MYSIFNSSIHQRNIVYTPTSQRVWILVDARPGTANQAFGMAEVLGIPFSIQYIQYKALAKLPNVFLSRIASTQILKNYSTLRPPWPDVIIVAGRRAALIGIWIKKVSAFQAFLIQIMFPSRIDLSDFDIIVLPNHDLRRYSRNIIRITGALNRITLATLSSAANYWRDRLLMLPRPWVVCLIGGTAGYRSFPNYLAHLLALQLLSVVGHGSILLTTSRRTTKTTTEVIKKVLISAKVPLFYHDWNNKDKENPYLGLLALSDTIVVTGDSISMCTEACAQPKPVFIFTHAKWINSKQGRLHAELFHYGYARPLSQDDNMLNWQHPSLDPKKNLAAIVKMKLMQRLRKEST